jgi:multimeric flavodoxin WrbA/protein-tyrosine-phosphatase
MFVLGLQGSPRRKGNTDFLLQTLLQEAQKLGAHTHCVEVARRNIVACKELIVCEKKGYCPIEDDMASEIYGLLRQADVVVLASPIFFYNVTAQLKALIDRCQTLWARRYRLHLEDPGRKTRRGFVLAVGATRGKNLFEGTLLTAKYFFDAIDAAYEGSLTYRRIEKRGEMEKHPTVREDVCRCVERLLKPLQGRRRLLFVCRGNTCRSQMAAAFAQHKAGERFDVLSAGTEPQALVNPDMVAAMAEKGLDMAFRRPCSLQTALEHGPVDTIVTLGADVVLTPPETGEHRQWNIADPAGRSMEVMRRVRDQIEKQVAELIG